MSSILEIDIGDLLAKYAAGDKLQRYLELLTTENEKTNLVSRETSPADLKRLLAESLVPFEKIEIGNLARYLDVGSGGGLPSIPIMISHNPAESTLIERRNKKAAALRRILLDLELKAEVFEMPFEDSEFDGDFDLITIRLVRLSKQILKKIGKLLKPSAVFIYYAPFESESLSADLSYSTYSYTTGHDTPVKAFTIFRKS